jgi:hypothetical protein
MVQSGRSSPRERGDHAGEGVDEGDERRQLILAERNQTWPFGRTKPIRPPPNEGGGAKSINAQGHIADFVDTSLPWTSAKRVSATRASAKAHSHSYPKCSSVPILKLASFRGTLVCGLRNRKDTGNVLL